MKIAIIGGGPAGLYLAILLKQWQPEAGIDVYERNAPNDTFGWGVVFSDKTLTYLKAEDVPSYEEITRRFATWDNVDVVHRDEKITIRGNKFSGIARIEILNILQERAAALGVSLHFRANVSDLAAFSGYDLVVGADGINSAIRTHFAAGFEPELSTRTNRYIWFGTPQLFHGLTLTFRENSAGVFAAHSYKFNTSLSTFIVECDEATWQKAGLGSMNEEETKAYLQEVFQNDLQGAPLLSNNSKWINFLLVKNRHWSVTSAQATAMMSGLRYPPVVLLGDSLATAHFSIGSGTKLALEDAIALFHAMRDTGEGLSTVAGMEQALVTFEERRRPPVSEIQQAAWDSILFFENLKDHVGLAPMAFAYKLMMRSGKIDLENLRRRDPEFVARYEASLTA